MTDTPRTAPPGSEWPHTPRAILERARLRIFEPKHWTDKARAETAQGVACSPCWHAAARWDAYGALQAEVGVESPEAFQAAAFLRRAAADLFAVESIKVSSSMGHGATLLMFGRALELAAQAETEALRVGVGRPASGADDPADHVFGLDQGGRAPDVRPGDDEGRRASAQAFLHFLEYVSPELRLPLAERPSQIVKEGAHQQKRDALSLRDHFIVFLHDRYSRMAAGENVDEAASASSKPPVASSPTCLARVRADQALAKARRAAAHLTDLQHSSGADTAENALTLMLASSEAARTYAAAAEATAALYARWERV